MELALTLGILAGIAEAESLQDKATFEEPPGWRLFKADSTDRAITRLYLLRKDQLNSRVHPSNALSQYYPVPKGG